MYESDDCFLQATMLCFRLPLAAVAVGRNADLCLYDFAILDIWGRNQRGLNTHSPVANQFVATMSKIYDVEKDHQTAILELLHTTGIAMQWNKIIGTDYTTDGSSLFNGHLLYALAELSLALRRRSKWVGGGG